VAANDLHLETPTPELESAYRDYLREFRGAASQEYQAPSGEAIGDFRAFVTKLLNESQGLGLPEGWVPQTTWWLVSNDERVIGELRLRHRLTPSLEDWGGHIGYAIRPSARGKGHGTRMLAMALDKARAMGLSGVLLTCESANTASARVIQKNGGRLISESVGCTGRLTLRYWIDLINGPASSQP
jgi:predicted acetyltransferase